MGLGNEVRARGTGVDGGNKLRVGIVAACPFPCNHGTPGGIREKAEALAELGHEVHVITYASCQPGEVRGVKIHRIPAFGPVNDVRVGPSVAKIFWNIALIFKLIQVVWRERLDVLHGINYEGAMIGWAAKVVTGRPLVYGAVNTMIDELHTYKFIRPQWLAKGLARVLDWAVPRMADRIVCYTHAIKNFLVDSGIPAHRVMEVKLGIDLSMFADAKPGNARERMGVNGEELVMYTGVLNKFQRIDYLLDAMKVVLAERPNAKVAFVRTLDDEEHRREVHRAAEERGVAHACVYPPILEFAELPAFIAAADLTVVPRPDCPGVPVKLLNFMAAGKPVVVTKGSSQGLRDGVEALVTADHDTEAMGRAILRVLDDAALAAELGRRARIVAYSEYDRLAAARHLADVYRESMEFGGAAARQREPIAAELESPSAVAASPSGGN